MEHDFKYPLDTGDIVTVTVDTHDSEPMPALCFQPTICDAGHIAKMFEAAANESDRIQRLAAEQWEMARARVLSARKGEVA